MRLKINAIGILSQTQQHLHDSLVDIDPKTIETHHYVEDIAFLRLTFTNQPFPKIYSWTQAKYIYEKHCKQHEEPEDFFLQKIH